MAAGQKLELTWIGKDKEERVEPRILIYDKEKSYRDCCDRRGVCRRICRLLHWPKTWERRIAVT